MKHDDTDAMGTTKKKLKSGPREKKSMASPINIAQDDASGLAAGGTPARWPDGLSHTEITNVEPMVIKFSQLLAKLNELRLSSKAASRLPDRMSCSQKEATSHQEELDKSSQEPDNNLSAKVSRSRVVRYNLRRQTLAQVSNLRHSNGPWDKRSSRMVVSGTITEARVNSRSLVDSTSTIDKRAKDLTGPLVSSFLDSWSPNVRGLSLNFLLTISTIASVMASSLPAANHHSQRIVMMIETNPSSTSLDLQGDMTTRISIPRDIDQFDFHRDKRGSENLAESSTYPLISNTSASSYDQTLDSSTNYATVSYNGVIGVNATDPMAITTESRSFGLSIYIQVS